MTELPRSPFTSSSTQAFYFYFFAEGALFLFAALIQRIAAFRLSRLGSAFTFSYLFFSLQTHFFTGLFYKVEHCIFWQGHAL